MNMYENYLKSASKFLSEGFEDEELGLTELPAMEDDGAELDVDINVEDEEEEKFPCPDCNGEGVVTDDETGEEVECETCGGTGEVTAEDAVFDFDPAEGVCPCCGAHLHCIDDEELKDLEDEELEDDEDLEDLEDDEDLDEE